MKKIYSLILAITVSIVANATVHMVNVSNFQFTPATFTANCNDTITWIFVSGNHTTTSTTIPGGAASWNAIINSSSTSFSYQPTVAGTYNYKCTPHNFVASFTVTCAVTPTVFQKDYGTADSLSDASGACVQPTSDGGYIATGYIGNFGAGGDDVYLVKTDANGNIEWTQTYGDADADDANFVIQSTDNGYAITGPTLSFGGESIFVIKTNSTGVVSWSKTYGTGDSTSDASSSSMQQTAIDGGYIITGYTGNY